MKTSQPNSAAPRELPAEHPSRERSDHANLERPGAHPGTRPAPSQPKAPSQPEGVRASRR